MGESTSLPEYDAHRLLASACYVLGVDTARLDEGVVVALLEEGVEQAFARKLERIEADAREVSTLWKEVCLNMPLLESTALKDTLESLKDFPTRYSPRFFAHEIPADIDYPLSYPVSETLQGVDYVATYLRRLLLECHFLQCFDVERCQAVLRAIHLSYGELILNVFEPVAINAVGCALAGRTVRTLQIGDADRDGIASLLEDLSAQQKCELLKSAATTACDAVGLRGDTAEDVRAYVHRLAVNLLPRIDNALRHHALAEVFVG